MTADEYETQPIIAEYRGVEVGILHQGVGLGGRRFAVPDLGAKHSFAAYFVDCLVAAGLDQPGAWIRRHSLPRPFFYSGGEVFLPCLCGRIEVAEQTDQRCQNATRLPAIH